MDRLTRKELKTDKFALEVGHGVEYVTEHKQQVIRYGAIAAGVVVIALAAYGFLSYRAGVRDDALRAALQNQDATVGGQSEEGRPSFPTQEAKDAAIKKSLTDVADKYPGSEEGEIARYYLGTMAADKGDLATAEKSLRYGGGPRRQELRIAGEVGPGFRVAGRKQGFRRRTVASLPGGEPDRFRIQGSGDHCPGALYHRHESGGSS